LLHVTERAAPATVHGERHLQSEEEAVEYLRQVAERLCALGIEAETHAQEDHAGLILLCTHGSGGIRDLLFGSIAQQVLKRGATPVLLARPAPDGSAPPFDPHRLLVPLDGTAAAEAALGPAEDLSRRL